MRIITESHNQILPSKSLYVDVRLSEGGVNSGVSRFTVGLCTAIVDLLKSAPGLELRFVGCGPVPAWIVPLIENQLGRVDYLSLPGFWFLRIFQKLSWVWSSWALWFVCRQFNQNKETYWLAPANTDAPLQFFAGKSPKAQVLQVLHDLIPISHPESVSLFFSLQLKLTMLNSIRLKRMVPTVSQKSSAEISDFVRALPISTKKSLDVFVVGNGIDSHFGASSRLNSQDLLLARIDFLQKLGAPVQLAHCRWICSIGRGQLYKSWDVAESAVENAHSKMAEGVLFLRVGIGAKDFHRLSKNQTVPYLKSLWFPQKRMLCPLSVTELDLAQIYRLSELCLHPSCAEGFGLPPLESVFCGTPVLYRGGTAVDECFGLNQLPIGFATGLNSGDPQVWTEEILDFFHKINDPLSEISIFTGQLGHQKPVRGFVADKMGGREYTWEAVAKRLIKRI